MTNGYMIGTVAYYLNESEYTDVSRLGGDLCRVAGEACGGNCYTGSWVTGPGFINVHFPKNFTRELTDREREELPLITTTLSRYIELCDEEIQDRLDDAVIRELGEVDSREYPE